MISGETRLPLPIQEIDQDTPSSECQLKTAKQHPLQTNSSGNKESGAGRKRKNSNGNDTNSNRKQNKHDNNKDVDGVVSSEKGTKINKAVTTTGAAVATATTATAAVSTATNSTTTTVTASSSTSGEKPQPGQLSSKTVSKLII